jgi:hypothetical protein
MKLPKSNYSSLSSILTHIRKYRERERIAYARAPIGGGIREHSLNTSLKLYIFPISTQAPRGDDRSAFYGAKIEANRDHAKTRGERRAPFLLLGKRVPRRGEAICG